MKNIINRKLCSLEDFNKARLELIGTKKLQKPIKNGIACPKCGAELIDTNPNVILESLPPQKNIHCEECDFIGYRIA